MSDIQQTTDFTIEYSGQEIKSTVKREGDTLHLHMENNIEAALEIQKDGSLVQTSGPELPPSTIDYVRKRVLGQDAIGSVVNTPSE